MVSYLRLHRQNLLRDRINAARALLRNCTLCPRRCGVDRLRDQKGKCRTGRYACVSSFGPHFGEEAPLVGKYGSGTIFFTNCNLNCVFCQNYSISQLGEGTEISPEQLAGLMIKIQNSGCHNINLVTPTHVVPQILEALELAIDQGLRIPLVYNSGGYDAVDTLAILDGVIDIYMPDAKYAASANAQKFSGIEEYPAINRNALLEMHRQVGALQIDTDGIARKGLLLRHLLLPNGLAGTGEIVNFIAHFISPNTYINIMDQYHPCYKASGYDKLNRKLTEDEYRQAINLAHKAGLHRLDSKKAIEVRLF